MIAAFTDEAVAFVLDLRDHRAAKALKDKLAQNAELRKELLEKL